MFYQLDLDPIDVDPDGIAENQTTAGAADLVLNGALSDLGGGVFDIYDAGYSAGIGGVRIAIDSAGDISAVVFTVYGTDQDGVEQTEEITGVTTTAVNSVTYWKTITRIAASAEVTSNVFVGPINQLTTESLVLNWRNNYPAAMAVVGLSGTVQFDVQESLSEIGATTTLDDLSWYTIQSNKTADLAAEFTRWATAARLYFDSYSSGAELMFQVRQGDYNNY